jgi:hypothetical protein
VIFWGLIIAVNGFLGPVIASWYSTKVTILGDEQFAVSKWFGINGKLYKPQEIVAFELRDDKRISEVKIYFVDGKELVISRLAQNFDLLCDYLTNVMARRNAGSNGLTNRIFIC